MSLVFDVASCVRASSKFSTCTKCLDICPVETLELVENLPAFTPSACVTCGGCVGICPTEAFSLLGVSTVDFFFEFLESQQKDLRCGERGIRCVSMLSVEHLIALALESATPLLVYPQGCHCGGESAKLQDQILANVEEANFVLESIANNKQIGVATTEPTIAEVSDLGGEAPTTDRRSFLSLKTAIKSKQHFDEAVDADEVKSFALDKTVLARMRETRIPDKRKLLFSVLKRQEKPQRYETLASEDISFVSQKYVDANCTNCQICYRICPTGALSSDKRFSVINFDAMLCMKCHLCHDACEPEAIHLQAGFETKELFEPTQRTLVTFNIKRCHSCGNHFTYTGGVQECFRCRIEEEEAMELHQNARKRDEEA